MITKEDLVHKDNEKKVTQYMQICAGSADKVKELAKSMQLKTTTMYSVIVNTFLAQYEVQD